MRLRPVTWSGAPVFVGTAGFAFVVATVHLFSHDAPLLPTLLGQWSLVALSVVFAVCGYYALSSASTPAGRETVGLRAGAGFCLAGVASAGYGAHQLFSPHASIALDVILFQATFVALVGGVAGTFVGLEKAQRVRTLEGLEETTAELAETRAEIRTEKHRFESLFGNASSAIADLRFDGQRLVVERANDPFTDWFGDRPEGTELFEATRIVDAGVRSAVVMHVTDGEVYEDEVTVGTDDVEGHYKLRVVPYEVGKDGQRAFALFTDVTELRETREKLADSVADLEASNERLEQFASAVSHDLREPLRMVTSYLERLDRRHRDDLDEEAREYVEFAVDGADRMGEMIDALLEYSRVETRGSPFERVELDDVVGNVRKDLRLRIEESDADVAVGPLPAVHGDTDQLRQLFQNLIDNALTYSGDAPPTVEVTAERNGDDWVVAVADDGVGIDPEQADRIFEVFQRLHTREEHEGTGIGLALCQRIAERHGGDIRVESEPGEGSTFYVTLPAAE